MRKKSSNVSVQIYRLFKLKIKKKFFQHKDRTESSGINIDELKTKLKNVSVEVKDFKTMLEKAVQAWQKYNYSYEVLNKWLNEQENKMNLDKVSDLIVNR